MFRLTAAALVLLALPAQAEMTGWMTKAQMHKHVARNMNGGKAYPRDIQCGHSNGKTYLRFDSVPFSGPPPFHRWQWVLEPHAHLTRAIANIGLTSRPDLKYRIVKSMSFDQNGTRMTCALLYR